MNRLVDYSMLLDLCRQPGVSGFEDPVARFVLKALQTHDIAAARDRIGNVVGRLGSGTRKIMFVAHMDEVGLIVRRVLPSGFLQVERVGGVSLQAVCGSLVQAWVNEQPVPGVVGALPGHLASAQSSLDIKDLYVDIGARNNLAAEQIGIEIGTPMTFHPVPVLGSRQITSKALDDRAGCFLLLKLAEELAQLDLQCEVIFAFIVQEENLLRGASPVVVSLKPDLVVGVDGTLAFDTPDLKDGQNDVALGKGPVVKVMDHIRGQGMGFIGGNHIRRAIENVALEAAIPFQREVVTGITTGISPLVFTTEGFPCAALSFPLRYSHTSVETANLEDLELLFNLLIRVSLEFPRFV